MDDVQLGGYTIPADSLVLFSVAISNLDEVRTLALARELFWTVRRQPCPVHLSLHGPEWRPTGHLSGRADVQAGALLCQRLAGAARQSGQFSAGLV